VALALLHAHGRSRPCPSPFSPTSITSFERLSRRGSSRLFTLLGQVLPIEFTCGAEEPVTGSPNIAAPCRRRRQFWRPPSPRRAGVRPDPGVASCSAIVRRCAAFRPAFPVTGHLPRSPSDPAHSVNALRIACAAEAKGCARSDRKEEISCRI
jgi:hypothetical protein